MDPKVIAEFEHHFYEMMKLRQHIEATAYESGFEDAEDIAALKQDNAKALAETQKVIDIFPTDSTRQTPAPENTNHAEDFISNPEVVSVASSITDKEYCTKTVPDEIIDPEEAPSNISDANEKLSAESSINTYGSIWQQDLYWEYLQQPAIFRPPKNSPTQVALSELQLHMLRRMQQYLSVPGPDPFKRLLEQTPVPELLAKAALKGMHHSFIPRFSYVKDSDSH